MLNKFICVVCIAVFFAPFNFAVELDLAKVHQGQRIRISDKALSRDYDRLFSQQFGLPISWLVYRIAEHESGQGFTLLAARLLSKTAAKNQLMERQLDQQIKLAILREFRFREILGKQDVYASLLKQEELQDVVEMALLDGMANDAEYFAPHALQLAVGGNEDFYPASTSLRMRRFANLVMLNQLGPDHDLTLQALRYAVTHDHLLVSKAVLEALPHGALPSLSLVALNRVLPAVSQRRRDIAWVISLLALRRAQISPDGPLMAPLVVAIQEGGSEVAHVVLRAVGEGRIAMTDALLVVFKELAKDDPVLAMVFRDTLGEAVWGNGPFKRIEQARRRIDAFSKPAR